MFTLVLNMMFKSILFPSSGFILYNFVFDNRYSTFFMFDIRYSKFKLESEVLKLFSRINLDYFSRYSIQF